jgi:hypothetical protein
MWKWTLIRIELPANKNDYYKNVKMILKIKNSKVDLQNKLTSSLYNIII